MKGRKGIPASIHVVQGTHRPSRHGAVSSIETGVAMPSRPEGLSEAVAAAWGHFGALLHSRKVLTAADGAALLMLCETFVEWQELCASIRAVGLVYEAVTESGAIMRRTNPEVPMRSDAARRLSALLGEFGITPAARGKVTEAAGADKAKNKFSALG